MTTLSSFEGLTPVEMAMEEFGSPKEKQEYLVGILYTYTNATDRALLYKVAGTCIKRYGFQAAVLSARTVGAATDKSLFGMMTSRCLAYDRAEQGDDRAQVEDFQKSTQAKSRIKSQVDYRRAATNPQEALQKLLFKGELEKETYALLEVDEAAALSWLHEYYMGE